MLKLARIACQIAAVYLGTLALALFLSFGLRGRVAFAHMRDPDPGPNPSVTTPEPPVDPKNCRPCTEGWMSIVDFYGAIECAHGPQFPISVQPYTSNSCPRFTATPPGNALNPTRDCKELNGGVVSPITGGFCACYSNCQGRLVKDPITGEERQACLVEFLVWMAWCGWEDDAHKNGPCGVHEQPAPRAVRNLVRKTRTKDGLPCRWTVAHDQKTFCGQSTAGVPPAATRPLTENFGCKSTNCEGFGDWILERPNRIKRCLGPNQDAVPPLPTVSIAR